MINVAHIGSGSISEYQIVTMESSTFKRVADFEALDTNMAAFYKTYRKILAVTYDVKLWRSANDPT